MHHAMPCHENPALDAARHLAIALDRPLLIYQGLAGRNRAASVGAFTWQNDRHHIFIMEGARDAAEGATTRGLRHVFHLGAQGTPALRSLAARAAAVVTEDQPAPPFPAWSASLAGSTDKPLWWVDTACVVAMRLAGKAFGRAFEFRKALWHEFEARLPMPWPEFDGATAGFDGDLGSADLTELRARCDIDHTVAPVDDTVGGSRAGHRRWQQFVERGPGRYAALRNDAAIAPPLGVSRLSPYLHYGQVSPMRVARVAHAHGSKGAGKYLDELLVWRELSHNFCFHHAHKGTDPGASEALPEWARKTLEAHSTDTREQRASAEAMARGRTGDRLWDAAQASLLVNGVLHNNVRMIWGKAPLNWSADPREALDTIIELNHRYALDGNDPNSYAGLLYSMGLFDRPFKPEQPVFGSVRTRPTHGHLKRIDIDAYESPATR